MSETYIAYDVYYSKHFAGASYLTFGITIFVIAVFVYIVAIVTALPRKFTSSSPVKKVESVNLLRVKVQGIGKEGLQRQRLSSVGGSSCVGNVAVVSESAANYFNTNPNRRLSLALSEGNHSANYLAQKYAQRWSAAPMATMPEGQECIGYSNVKDIPEWNEPTGYSTVGEIPQGNESIGYSNVGEIKRWNESIGYGTVGEIPEGDESIGYGNVGEIQKWNESMGQGTVKETHKPYVEEQYAQVRKKLHKSKPAADNQYATVRKKSVKAKNKS